MATVSFRDMDLVEGATFLTGIWIVAVACVSGALVGALAVLAVHRWFDGQVGVGVQ